MTTGLRERTNRDAQARQAHDEDRHLGGPMVWGVASVLLAVLGAVIAVAVVPTGDTGTPETMAQALTNDERICQLANQGRVPLEACSAATTQQPTQPLYTTTELEMIRLVEGGRLPEGTLDNQTFLIKRLANEGEIPRDAAFGLTTP